jgi:hypothetical protein
LGALCLWGNLHIQVGSGGQEEGNLDSLASSAAHQLWSGEWPLTCLGLCFPLCCLLALIFYIWTLSSWWEFLKCYWHFDFF